MEAGVYQTESGVIQETSGLDKTVAAKNQTVSAKPSKAGMELPWRGTRHMEICHSI